MRANHKRINTVQSKTAASGVWAQQAFLGSSDLVSTLLPGPCGLWKIILSTHESAHAHCCEKLLVPTADGIGLTKY